jgi:hypothetical protein
VEQAELTPQAGKFIENIVALRNGAVVNEIGDRLQALISAVKETNSGNSTSKGGCIVIKLTVAPFTPGQSDAVIVEATLTEKFPRPALGRTVFFVNDMDELTQQNPKQLRLVVEEAAVNAG